MISKPGGEVANVSEKPSVATELGLSESDMQFDLATHINFTVTALPSQTEATF